MAADGKSKTHFSARPAEALSSISGIAPDQSKLPFFSLDEATEVVGSR
jgi:hypothetical protein